jgi:addiction module RelB/DinJ family antitoxin
MVAGYSYVQVRIDAGTKKRASEVLATMGLTISAVIRFLLEQVASEGSCLLNGRSRMPPLSKP